MATGDKIVNLDVLKVEKDYAQSQIDILNSNIDGITSASGENMFDMSVFDGVTGITKVGFAHYKGEASAFKAAFENGIPGLTFEEATQYYLSFEAYAEGESTSTSNGLRFRINMVYGSTETSTNISVPLNTHTFTKYGRVSDANRTVTSISITWANGSTAIWHVRNIMLVKSPAAVDYVPYNTAKDIVARNISGNSVYSDNVSDLLVSGGYINLMGLYAGDTVTLTPVANINAGYVLADVQAGDAFILTTTGASAARPYAFIDANNKVTAISTGSLTRANDTIIAPEAGKMIVNSLTSGDFSLHKIVNAQTAEGLLESYYIEKDRKTHKWRGKKIVAFGDSRTSYDKIAYTEYAKPDLVGNICVGYQEQMRNLMMADVVSRGVSGDTSTDICTRIKAFDFTGYDAVLLEGGINDFVKSSQVTIGEIQPIGGTFDDTTVYGAWQSAIEYMLTNYPGMQIYLTIPAIAWTSAGVFPYNIAKIKGEIAELYNLPCIDLYKNGGINEINRDNWYCDNVSTTNWRLHFNDDGNALIGAKIAEFMIAN